VKDAALGAVSAAMIIDDPFAFAVSCFVAIENPAVVLCVVLAV
jgi:hypothetical protein